MKYVADEATIKRLEKRERQIKRRRKFDSFMVLVVYASCGLIVLALMLLIVVGVNGLPLSSLM